MSPLRQRLLLVAGWAVAAVATGLVSAGAVAVAGGQVTDRPLQPLSAAEVAALPVTIEDPCVTSERLASGGSASLAECPDRVSSFGPYAPGDVPARPAEKEEPEALPPLDPVDAAAIAEGSGLEADREISNLSVGARPPEPHVSELVGGRVSVTVVDEYIVLNAATPRPGYVAGFTFLNPDELIVTFWNGTQLSTLSVTLDPEGKLQLRLDEGKT